jgi:hypothetical protein
VEIVVIDIGDATDFNIFSSHDRKAFNDFILVIIKVKCRYTGSVVITAESDGLPAVTCTVLTR